MAWLEVLLPGHLREDASTTKPCYEPNLGKSQLELWLRKTISSIGNYIHILFLSISLFGAYFRTVHIKILPNKFCSLSHWNHLHQYSPNNYIIFVWRFQLCIKDDETNCKRNLIDKDLTNSRMQATSPQWP